MITKKFKPGQFVNFAIKGNKSKGWARPYPVMSPKDFIPSGRTVEGFDFSNYKETEMIYINIDNCFSPYPIKNEHEWYVAEEDTHKTKEHKHTWLFYPSFRGTNDHYFCNGCSITSKEKPT